MVHVDYAVESVAGALPISDLKNISSKVVSIFSYQYPSVFDQWSVEWLAVRVPVPAKFVCVWPFPFLALRLSLLNIYYED